MINAAMHFGEPVASGYNRDRTESEFYLRYEITKTKPHAFTLARLFPA